MSIWLPDQESVWAENLVYTSCWRRVNLFRLLLCLKLVSSRIPLMDILVTFNLIITNVEICLAFYFAHFGITLSQSPRILSPQQQRINLFCVQYSNKSMLSRLLFIFSYMKSVCLPIYQSSLSTSSKLLKKWRPKQVLYFYMLPLDGSETLLYFIF